MTRNSQQIWIWFEGHVKGFMVQTEILAAIFNWISKQQLNFGIVSVKLILPKVGADEFTGSRRESDVR